MVISKEHLGLSYVIAGVMNGGELRMSGPINTNSLGLNVLFQQLKGT